MNRLNLSYVNFRQGLPENNIYYLPYSAGILWSYCAAIPSIANTWSLDNILWRRDNIDDIYKKIADCEVLGLSTYVWNKNYNFELGRKVKEYNPNVKIVLGGPEVAVTNPDLFKQLPWADIAVKKEGELVFADILSNIDSYQTIPGLCVNDNGNLLDTGSAVRIKDINCIPSPYLTGVFDNIIRDNPDITWNAILETNRGCPYQCTFCDWGSLTYSKVSKFDLTRVFTELEWMAQHKVDFTSIADANFGLFMDRDDQIIDKIIELQRDTGYPKRIAVSWAKNQKADVIKLVKKLFLNGMNNGLTVSTQSLTPAVLKNIKRQNLDSHRISETFDLCNKAGIPVTTEMILGLPGETLASWKNNLYSILDLGLHSGMELWIAQALENAELNLTQRNEFEIKTKLMYDLFAGCDQDREILEGVEVVVATKDMPEEDLAAALIFNWFILSFHIGGPAQWYSRFLHKQGISYNQFYENLWNYCQTQLFFQKEKEAAESIIDHYLNGNAENCEKLFGVSIDIFNLTYLGIMRMRGLELHDQYLKLVDDFVATQYSNLLDPALMYDINQLTKCFMVNPMKLDDYPLILNLKNDVYGYVVNDTSLNNECSLMFTFADNTNMSLEAFLRNIYLKRRLGFGKARIEYSCK